jgi:hypothetical protein
MRREDSNVHCSGIDLPVFKESQRTDGRFSEELYVAVILLQVSEGTRETKEPPLWCP